MKNKFYVTTPIYYPSANPHLGNAYCTVLTDIYARYRRIRGFETYFLTGTDEHGLKIEKNAEKAGVSPQIFVDKIAENFKKLWKTLEISNDDFIRTTEDRHTKAVQDIFSKLLANDDIYLGEYKGWYCTQCEAFWTDTQAGKDHICPDCGRPVQEASEEAYFFRTSKYLDRLLAYYKENTKFIIPESRLNEMINTFIKPGLEDLCVSRTSFTWGIQVREKPKHVIYVWLDALSNYITALGYDSKDESLFEKFWVDENSEIIHILGADITRFHAIYWPMFLMALNLRLPDRELVHGLLMMKDGKMSKSKGNVIEPFSLIEHFGVDTVRYYLAREMRFGDDGQFTPELFVERINIDLVNNLGNLLNRVVSMINKYFNGEIPSYAGDVTEFDRDLRVATLAGIEAYETYFNDLKITEAFVEVMDIVSRANKYIDDTKPWALAKDETKTKELQSVMVHLANVIYTAGILLEPVLVKSSSKILDQLGVPESLRSYDNIKTFGVLSNAKVNKGELLFPRLDALVEVEFIKNSMKSK